MPTGPGGSVSCICSFRWPRRGRRSRRESTCTTSCGAVEDSLDFLASRRIAISFTSTVAHSRLKHSAWIEAIAKDGRKGLRCRRERTCGAVKADHF